MCQSVIYLDNAATTPVLPEVADIVYHALKHFYGNPSSIHQVGRHARVEVEKARRIIAGLFNAQPGEVFFTSGGTEANNTILAGCARELGRKHFITSKLEHPSVLNMLEALRRHDSCSVSYVNFDTKGILDLEHLDQLLHQNTGSVVTLMHANNEIGNLLPMKEVGGLCKKHHALFHSDTVQTAGKFALDLQKLQVDFAVVSAHKFHGPKGVGAMFVRAGSGMKPYIFGGAQERNLRAGTENVPGIMGMAKALEMVTSDMESVFRNVSVLRSFLIEKLPKEIPGLHFLGDATGSSLYSILNFALPGRMEPGYLMGLLDLAGICASAGSACASGSNKPSPVLLALGMDPLTPNLRISLSRYNTLEDVQKFVEVLKEICIQGEA